MKASRRHARGGFGLRGLLRWSSAVCSHIWRLRDRILVDAESTALRERRRRGDLKWKVNRRRLVIGDIVRLKSEIVIRSKR